MKKVVIVLFITLLCKTAPAQIMIALLFGDKLNTDKLEFGLVVSPALTGISNIEGKRNFGINLGTYFNIKMKTKISIYAELVAKAVFGAREMLPYPVGNDTLNTLFLNGSVEKKIKGFSLPILFKYSIAPKFFIETGIQADMMIGAKDIFNSTINDNDLDYTIKVNSQVALLDFGFTGGLYYKLRKDRKSMGIGIRYFQGLTDILKSTDGNQANSAWQINVTIPMGGAGKSGTAAGTQKTSPK